MAKKRGKFMKDLQIHEKNVHFANPIFEEKDKKW